MREAYEKALAGEEKDVKRFGEIVGRFYEKMDPTAAPALHRNKN